MATVEKIRKDIEKTKEKIDLTRFHSFQSQFMTLWRYSCATERIYNDWHFRQKWLPKVVLSMGPDSRSSAISSLISQP